MAFWSDIQNTPEPLRQYRWYLQLGTSLDNLRYALMECGKPEMEITTSEHLLLNHYFKYPGLVKWKPINIKMASVRGNKDEENTAQIFYDLIYKSGYRNPEIYQENHINKSDFTNAISDNGMQIIQINELGQNIEIWNLYNPLINNIKYGTLSYSSEDIVTVEATINYDFADLIIYKDKKES